MIGGSYGGGIQFAAASVDPRIDTIVPLITWNDLSYSLDPNNTAQTQGVSTSTPGAIKLTWGLLFSADGAADGLGGGVTDPSRLYGCPNFADFVCSALVTGGSTGYFQPGDIAKLRHASVANFMSKIRIPTLLIQGENDTLFNLNEAAATYAALKAQGTPVQMIWQSWGHSQSTPAPGELDLSAPDPATQYETARVARWFAHYLRDSTVTTGPAFSYFRDWVSYTGIATPAYATSSIFPVGVAHHFYLDGDGSLASDPNGLVAGSQTFLTPPAGPPTSVDPLDVIGSFAPSGGEENDAPGTFASWTSAPLSSDLDVAGSPTVTVRVNAPAAALTQGTGPAGQLVLFAKIADVGTDGKASLINGLVAPIRIPDVTQPVKIRLPGIVHRFAAGHSIRLVLAGGALNYRGGLTPNSVTVAGGSTSQVLNLPVVG
jgi:ABC-2 type transport system ATP-binding protein